MSDDDLVNDMTSVTMTATAAAARAAEVLVRHAQEAKLRSAAGARSDAADYEARAAAMADVADSWLTSTDREDWATRSSPEEIAGTIRAAHEWEQVDAERFGGHAERLHEQYNAAFGIDLRERAQDARNFAAVEELAAQGVVEYREAAGLPLNPREAPGYAPAPYDSAEGRGERLGAMVVTEVEPAAIKARDVADHLNSANPRTRFRAGVAARKSGPGRSGDGPAVTSSKQKTTGPHLGR